MPAFFVAPIGAVSPTRSLNDGACEDEGDHEVHRPEERAHRRSRIANEHETSLDHDEADRELQDAELSGTIRGVWGRHARVLMETRTGFGKIAISPAPRPFRRASPSGARLAQIGTTD